MRKEMTFERLVEIVEAYGASAFRWPQAEREAAQALVSRDPQARALIDEARHIDAILDASPESFASDALVARVMAARPRALQEAAPAMNTRPGVWRVMVQIIWPYGSPAFPAGALAASVALGIGLGMASPVAVSALGLSATANATTSEAGEQLVAFALAENEYPEDWKK